MHRLVAKTFSRLLLQTDRSDGFSREARCRGQNKAVPLLCLLLAQNAEWYHTSLPQMPPSPASGWISQPDTSMGATSVPLNFLCRLIQPVWRSRVVARSSRTTSSLYYAGHSFAPSENR